MGGQGPKQNSKSIRTSAPMELPSKQRNIMFFFCGELERILGCTGSCARIPAFVCRFDYFRFASVLGEEKTVCEDEERPEAISEMSFP